MRPGIQALLSYLLAQAATMSWTVSALIADGDVLGRRDRGSNAASPSDRYRVSRAYIEDRATP